MSGPRPAGPGQVPPRLLVAMALVAAAASTVVAVLLTIPTISPEEFRFTSFSLLERVQIGTRPLDVPVLLLVPFAVLLARLVERGSGGAPPLARTVLSAATVVGAALALLVLLRLVAHLGGQEYLVGPMPKVGSFFYDLGALLVAVAGPYWAFSEQQRSRPEHGASGGRRAGPPPFPGSPPGAPGPPSQPPRT